MGNRARSLLAALAVTASALTPIACNDKPTAPRAPADVGAPTPAMKPVARRHFYYVHLDDLALASLSAHAPKISTLAMMGYRVEADGKLSGEIDSRALPIAKQHNIDVIPLVVNAAFDQTVLASLFANEAAQASFVRTLISTATTTGFKGWELDIENIPIDHRDDYTKFVRRTGQRFRAAGLTLGVAVVPRSADQPASNSSYARWLFENWQGGYDYRALADAADYLSLMAYGLHTKRTTPGPNATTPWVEASIRHLLASGVPKEKLLLGIATYSRHWFPDWSQKDGGFANGRAMTFNDANAVLQRIGKSAEWTKDDEYLSATWQSGGWFEYLFLEDQRAFAARRRLIDTHGLAGYAVYRLGWEDPRIWDGSGP